jgi:hypothetical protein
LNWGVCGKDKHDRQGQAQAEVFGAPLQPVPALRSSSRILEEVPVVPDMLSQSGAERRNPRSDQIELVETVGAWREETISGS